jgi:DNA-3-methyladenine glycosylase
LDAGPPIGDFVGAATSLGRSRRRRASRLEAFPERLLEDPAEQVAPRLLGATLRSTVGGVETSGRIVEVEAYVGLDDPASHAARRIGRTRRNEAMFGPPGTAYVYRSYGIHWCLNVVTSSVGDPSAVLVRALAPLTGHDVMQERRGRSSHVCSGPGRLCEALGISGELDGHRLDEPPLELLLGQGVEPGMIRVGPRVGITRARDWPLRFWIDGDPHVSRRPGDGTLLGGRES